MKKANLCIGHRIDLASEVRNAAAQRQSAALSVEGRRLRPDDSRESMRFRRPVAN